MYPHCLVDSLIVQRLYVVLRNSGNADILIVVIVMNVNSKTVALRRRGTLTLPIELRRKYRLEEGEPMALLDFDGVFVLAPKVPAVPKLVRELERLRQEAGLEVEDLMNDLDEERQRLYEERYHP